MSGLLDEMNDFGFEITRISDEKGEGWIATRDIKASECICTENALIFENNNQGYRNVFKKTSFLKIF